MEPWCDICVMSESNTLTGRLVVFDPAEDPYNKMFKGKIGEVHGCMDGISITVVNFGAEGLEAFSTDNLLTLKAP
ncbi:MAG TPA: hypothetical protein VGM63_25420 [Mucilaginibacter sp.]|jgi:hypothetical protein